MNEKVNVQEELKNPKYSEDYTPNNFWDKVKRCSKLAGSKVILAGLKLYYALQSGKVTPTEKAIIIAALGYLISPIDAIPDVLVGLGYTDDLLVLLGALKTLGNVDSSVDKQAQEKMDEIFK